MRNPQDHSSRKTPASGFTFTTIADYVREHVKSNPQADRAELTLRLRKTLEAQQDGEKCTCGEEIWVLGSSEVGLMCFTCITGEAVPNSDYEIIAEK